MKYAAVIFDMDGTILNTLDDLTDSLNYVLGKMGYPLRTAREVAGFLGNGVNVLVKKALPGDAGAEKTAEFLAAFKARYKDHLNDRTRPYDGIMDLLGALKERGVKTAVVSNKFDAAVKLLSREYFGGLLESSVGESETVRRKPAPDGVLMALKELGAEKDEALYVGDSEVDVETAKNAGLACAGVTWGFREKEVLVRAGADYLIDRPEELLQIVENGTAM